MRSLFRAAKFKKQILWCIKHGSKILNGKLKILTLKSKWGGGGGLIAILSHDAPGATNVKDVVIKFL